MRFPSGGHFVDAIHAKGAFQLSFCRYFRQKLFVLNLYVSMIDKSHRPKSHFLGWNTSLTRKITKDIDKYQIWNICHRQKTTTNTKSERGKLFILLLLLSLLSFFHLFTSWPPARSSSSGINIRSEAGISYTKCPAYPFSL